MTEETLLTATASRIFNDFVDVDGSDAGWNSDLWTVLEDCGLTLVGIDEASGGSGGGLDDVASLLKSTGYHSASVPLGETILAAMLLAAGGLPIHAGPLTVAACDASTFVEMRDDWVISTTLKRVPWGRVARRVVLFGCGLTGRDHDQEFIASVDPSGCDLNEGQNVAGEPRDDLTLNLTIPHHSVAAVPSGTLQKLCLRSALHRVLTMAGAAERSFESTISYAGERQQFGRPIGQFQAVQQQVAEMAGEVVALQLAGEAAVAYCERSDFSGNSALMAVASAKLQAGHTASVVTRVAHQVHGAIGFTREHDLRLSTTRLWAWRDEYGNETIWSSRLGSMLINQASEVLWHAITRGPHEPSI